MELIDKLKKTYNIEWIKLELLKTAYGKKETYLGQVDPRTVIIWYFIVSLLPWFTFNIFILLGLMLYTSVLAVITRVSPLIIFLLSIGILSELGYIFLVVFLLGGDVEAYTSLLILTFKISIMSIASVAAFASMDPEKLSDALLSFGVPAQFSFAVSYGYRMLPILMDEYQQIIQSFRLRGKAPQSHGFLKWRIIYYYTVIVVKAFYPMMLNTAKRTRTTVEALEVRGFSYSLHSSEAKKQKLSHLTFGSREHLFIGINALLLIVIHLGGHWHYLL
ncbi:energy-coupling factor transporter transmembrane component T family protein [Marinococcus luteus]|uniref:energy-coupling factor transporter transmembrane component T family protein n=1 Tax=Marinococcus luteus TaxID=1122204 RepID=UPI002ACC8367|nr:energy-coupling factor transporter transmembrane component T [Marinococcus luteus]MDZ5782037.1 energy-coupling factor transporter transmembrane component T [Marinococcus luteus]